MKNSEVGISIIIPVHNNENSVEKCVCSIVDQNYADKEIILIENGSVDGSFEKCKALEKRFEGIKVVKTSTPGVSHARNMGLDLATKEIIGFCDADDYYEPNTLWGVDGLYRRKNFDILVMGYNWIRGQERKVYSLAQTDQTIGASQLLKYVIYKDEVLGSVWNKFYRRDAIGSTRFKEDLQLCEDTFFNIAVLNHKDLNCVVSNVVGYDYIVNENSATNSLEKLFDNSGKLKYISTFERAIRELQLSRSDVRYCRFKIASFAIEILYRNQLDGERKKRLLCDLKENVFVFLFLAIRIHDRKSMKLIVMLFLLLTKLW